MRHFDTKAVQITQKFDGKEVPKTKPIYQTSAFLFKDLDDLESFYQGDKDFLYTRISNPNTDELGKAVALLEGAPEGVATSSGMSAILAGILSVVKAGDHVVACEDLYGGTYQLLANELSDYGVEVTFVPFQDQEAVRHAIKSSTKLLFSESMSNPLLRVEDLEEMVRIAKENKLLTMVDNTFATPYLVQPYSLGVNLVVHSATKYIGGHSDVTAGVLVGDAELLEKAKAKVVNLGLNLGPFDAWLASRGIKTMSVRMERHVKNAEALANALKQHEAIKRVYYPKGLSSNGNGAIVSIELSGQSDVKAFFKNLGWIKIIATLAGVETSVSYPFGTSHRALPPTLREKLSINERVIRISVGIENHEDIISAFTTALNASLV